MKLLTALAVALVTASSLTVAAGKPIRITTSAEGDTFFSRPDSWKFDNNSFYEHRIVQINPTTNKFVTFYHRIAAADCLENEGLVYIRKPVANASWTPIHRFNKGGTRVSDQLAKALCYFGQKSVGRAEPMEVIELTPEDLE